MLDPQIHVDMVDIAHTAVGFQDFFRLVIRYQEKLSLLQKVTPAPLLNDKLKRLSQ